MENLSCVINVQVDSKDKEAATKILKDLGLNMSTFINMAIKQVIKKNGVPFEVRNPYPSVELLEALEESNKIIEEIKNGKKKMVFKNIYVVDVKQLHLKLQIP